jgi:hypothetical protein
MQQVVRHAIWQAPARTSRFPIQTARPGYGLRDMAVYIALTVPVLLPKEVLMKLNRPLLALLMLYGFAAWAEPEIAERYDSAPSTSTEAVALAARCAPGTSESSFLKMVRDAGSNALVTTRPADRSKPYLLVNGTRTICVPMSEKLYPILALESFEDTVSFPDMDESQQRLLRTSLARQIARTGTASALVKNDQGNAFAVTYLLTADRPTKFYYHASFLKAGEFNEARYEIVLSSSSKMSIVGRGQPSEQVKHLFQK